ncbi:MAG: hypothetical protein PWQ91_1753 [Eubacteriales bacterium]|nr:hypothetical protein [Eubacteriales bacterium]
MFFKDARHEVTYKELVGRVGVEGSREVLGSLYMLAATEKQMEKGRGLPMRTVTCFPGQLSSARF